MSTILDIECCQPPQAPHSFPTRRSSDLMNESCGAAAPAAELEMKLPETTASGSPWNQPVRVAAAVPMLVDIRVRDRKSTRLNSSHVASSYAVFCLKKKKQGMYI